MCVFVVLDEVPEKPVKVIPAVLLRDTHSDPRDRGLYIQCILFFCLNLMPILQKDDLPIYRL